jgi:hypothetical protein
VSAEAFQAEVQDAFIAGFAVVDRPSIRRSQAALLRRG